MPKPGDIVFRYVDPATRALTIVASVEEGELLVWTGQAGAVHGDKAIRLDHERGRALADALYRHYAAEGA